MCQQASTSDLDIERLPVGEERLRTRRTVDQASTARIEVAGDNRLSVRGLVAAYELNPRNVGPSPRDHLGA